MDNHNRAVDEIKDGFDGSPLRLRPGPDIDLS